MGLDVASSAVTLSHELSEAQPHSRHVSLGPAEKARLGDAFASPGLCLMSYTHPYKRGHCDPANTNHVAIAQLLPTSCVILPSHAVATDAHMKARVGVVLTGCFSTLVSNYVHFSPLCATYSSCHPARLHCFTRRRVQIVGRAIRSILN